MSLQQGQFMSTLQTRFQQVRTTARSRVDQVRARVQGMGIGGGGMFKGIMNKAPIKTYNQGFARGGILDRYRTTRSAPSASAVRGNIPPPMPGRAPVMTFMQPGQAQIKTFSKESLRAIKTF